MKIVHQYAVVPKRDCTSVTFFYYCRTCQNAANFNTKDYIINRILSDSNCQGCKGNYTQNIHSGWLTRAIQ